MRSVAQAVSRMVLRTASGACVVALVGLSVASPSQAAFGVSAFDGAVSDSAGDAYTRAGGHPDSASTTFELNRTLLDGYAVPEGGDLRTARVDLPAGFTGNPTAMPACDKGLMIPNNVQAREGDFDANDFCPLNTIVGIVSVKVIQSSKNVVRLVAPLFNLEPPPGMPAQFGFSIYNQNVVLDTAVRSDRDYGVSVTVRNANEIKSALGSTVTLWGKPADHSHDDQRCMAFFNSDPTWNDYIFTFPEAGPLPECATDFLTLLLTPWNAPHAANVISQAMVTNPTACTSDGVGLETRLRVESWNPDSAPDEASFISHLPPGFPLPVEEWGAPHGPDECDHVPFDPTAEVSASTAKADAPSGLSVDLSFPQEGLVNPTGTATGQLKRATVTLPDGWSVSPAAADGLVGCSDAESRVGTLLGASCPLASKVGTVEATTPLLKEKLTGGVYVGTQESDDPLSGRMFRMFIALNSEERGVRVKLPGQIKVNPDTGRIETTFDNNPQVPVSSISLRVKSGPRAPLATPLSCGTKPATVELESWSGAVVTRTSGLAVDCPGAGPLRPTFAAGVTDNAAGRHTNFVLRANRADGQQVMSGLSLRMPDGLLAKLRGVPLCPDAAASAGACPEASRVGTATVGAGPGTNPFFLQGGVYLTGPYKRGPFGLAVAVQAKAGPFDLGVVVVRQQLIVDPIDAHVSVISDPLPTIVRGVPVRLRSLNVDVDRKDFVRNPTSCKQKTLVAAFGATDGSVFSAASPFGVSNCSALPIKPTLRIALTGRKQTTDGKHPGVRAIVVQRPGDANLKRVSVKLPLSLALDPDNARALCEFTDGTKVDPTCPKGSIVGRATARTPLLDRPLTAPVYFVKNVRIDPRTGRSIRTLPMLVIPLRGEDGIKLNLKGTSDVSRDHLVNKFDTLPDAPVSRFELTIDGGRNGILVANGNLCRRKQIADTQIDAQNGKPSNRKTTISTPVCKRGKGSRR